MRLKTSLLRRHRDSRLNFLLPAERRSKILRLGFILLGLAVIHVAAMVYFEALSIWDAIWLTMTTMTTVGYGDLSPVTHGGRLTTMIIMYGFGIFLLAQIAGEWIDYRFDRYERKRKGLWTWNMNNHILIINTPGTNGDRYLQILTEQILDSQTLSDHSIQILSGNFPDGLPNNLLEQGVVLHQGAPESAGVLDQVNVEEAAYVIVLATDTVDHRSDSVTLDILDRLKQYDLKGYVIAECLQDENRQRLREHGANAVIRPVRAYPELLVRALVAPGSEAILEDLFKNEGVHSRRYNVELNGQLWKEIAVKIVSEGLGTAVGYLGENGIVTNPQSDEQVFGSALFILVCHDRVPEEKVVSQVLTQSD